MEGSRESEDLKLASPAAWLAGFQRKPAGVGDWNNRMSGEEDWRGRSKKSDGDGGGEEWGLQLGGLLQSQAEAGGLENPQYLIP